MKLNFCTLFDKNYLARGLVLYDSLDRVCSNFTLYVLAFDNDSFDYLESLKKDNIVAVRLSEFENDELLKVKAERSPAEYCWTCSASSIYYFITKYKLDHCTYIDADMYFYSSPSVLIAEMGNNSVLITPHNYSPEYDDSSVSGRYCVQFVSFKNDLDGMATLKWWKDSCIEWCFNKVEDGKFGDQKYLDEFAIRFNGVYECQHLGAGIAPWNLQQYSFQVDKGKISCMRNSDSFKFEPVFFHFHGLKFYLDNIVNYTGSYYDLNQTALNLFYVPYVSLLVDKERVIRGSSSIENPNGGFRKSPARPVDFKMKVFFYLSGIKQSFRNFGFSYMRKRVARHYFYRY